MIQHHKDGYLLASTLYLLAIDSLLTTQLRTSN